LYNTLTYNLFIDIDIYEFFVRGIGKGMVRGDEEIDADLPAIISLDDV
jgi:hypothetical protein